MSDSTFNVAIDLGATSAKMACCRSGSVSIIPNREGAIQTPCAVWLNSHGQFVIGQKAKEALSTDPDNIQVNFIRDLGSDVEYTFPRLSRRFKPEDLAAELLKSLRLEAETFTGQEIGSAVISVPLDADFAVREATKRAASTAGFAHCVLLQDAVAAAMGGVTTVESLDSTVLIYDFGGNRFHASILRIRDGIFQIVAKIGDSLLGGAILDRAVVEKVFIPALRDAHPAIEVAADNPQTRSLYVKLQAEGETAKLRLNRSNETSVFIPRLGDDNRGQPIDFHYELTRNHLEMLAAPLVERSISICRQLLADAHVTASEITNVIAVGGMVAMPFVRQKLEESFDQMAIPVSSSVDPTTAVVRGAAIFAGMQSLPNESPAIRTQAEFQLELNYQPISPDPEPLISGIVRAHDAKEMDFTGFAIEFSRVEPQEWRSGKVDLSKDGRFITTLSAEEARNTFRIELNDVAGVQQTLVPNAITITVAAASVANVGLTHSIGLALSNNEVLPLFGRGTTLPARRRVSLRTTVAFSRGQRGDALRFPLIEGENHRADRNREIGIVAVPFESTSRDMPAGTEVEITIVIDDSRQFIVSTYIPILDEEFEHRIALRSMTPACGELAEQLHRLKARLISVRERTRDDALAAKERTAIIDGDVMAHAERLLLLADHDADAARQCADNLNAINSALDEAEDALMWPGLVEEAKKDVLRTRELLTKSGQTKADERVEMTDLERATHEAIDRRNAVRLRECSERVNSLYQRLVMREPAFWLACFDKFRQQSAERQLPANVQELIAAGNRAVSNNDLEGLKNAVRGLNGLLAPACSSPCHTSTLTLGPSSVSSPPAGESREITHRSNVDQIVQQAIEVFNHGQKSLKHQNTEIRRREIVAGLEIARADLLRAAELGSVRARDNLQIADTILAQIRDGSFGLSDRFAGCIQEAGEAAAREDWQTAVDKLRIVMREAGSHAPDSFRKNLAVALANRGVASANKLNSILTEERGVSSAWKPPSSEKLNAAIELAKQAKQDLEEAAEIDSKGGHIQENLRKVNEILSQLSKFRSYGSGARSVEAPSQGPRTSWLKGLMQKIRPTHKLSQAPDDDLAEQQDRNAATTKEKHGGTPLQAAAAKSHKDVADLLLDNNTKGDAKDRGTPEVPGGRIDDVHFSVTSPRCVLPGHSFILDVWAHLKRQRQAVIKQAREAIAGGEIVIQSKGPIQVARGAVLSVLLKIDGMSVKDPQDTIFWKGDIGNARFPVMVPDDAKEGSRSGLATIYLDGVQIAKIHFSLMVGKEASAENDVPFQVKHHRKAFASYASQDRNDVLTSIQGMEKADPGLDVFYDEANLRSGASWEQELKRVIPESDVFYLFWSASAKASRWVDMEWRWALERRGIEFIDPVPLVSPEEVPPPEELGGKHFKDWVLAYRRRRP